MYKRQVVLLAAQPLADQPARRSGKSAERPDDEALYRAGQRVGRQILDVYKRQIYARLSVENSGKSEKVDVIANQIEICKSYIAAVSYTHLMEERCCIMRSLDSCGSR